MYTQNVGHYVLVKNLMVGDVGIFPDREVPLCIHAVQNHLNRDYELVNVRTYASREESQNVDGFVPIIDINPNAKVFVLRHIYG